MSGVLKTVRWPLKRLLVWVLALVVLGSLAAWLMTLRFEIDPIERPLAASFSSITVARGAGLAAVGDCAVCHTATQGRPLAGGKPLATPFGTIYATNITPDAKTGIGRWSLEAFKRAMRDGISREGQHLYPALPYEHFTHTSDADLQAVYAFLMTRDAVTATAPANELIPPLGFRPLLAGWKLLFLHDGPYVADDSQTAEWNRGGYLVESLGHCGGCHTPRNLAGGETTHLALKGGVAEGWNAPAIDSTNPSASRWDVNGLYNYLRRGADPAHGMAGGPMGPVVHALSTAPPEDVKAIAVYIHSKMNPSGSAPQSSLVIDRMELAARQQPLGATLFGGACVSCHAAGSPMSKEGRAPLSLVTAVQSEDPRNALMTILQGVHSEAPKERPFMPAYDAVLDDAQIAALAGYLRARFTDRPPWPELERATNKARKAAAP